jgi:serine/threonine-protein kinase
MQAANTDAVKRAEAEFQHAIDLDPNYAQAYLELARAKWAEARARGSNYRTELERNSAAELCHKALQLDPNLPDAHALLGELAMEYDWDWSTAERELRSALAGPPNAKAELSYAFFLIFHHRFAEADQHLRRAQELEPFDTSNLLNLSQAFYLEGRFAQLRETSQRLLAMHPDLIQAQLEVAGTHIWDGEPQLALTALARIRKPFPALPFYEAMARARAGQSEQALQLIRPYEEKYPDSGVALQWIAKVHAMVGDEPNTVKWLERSADRREWQALTIAVNPVFAPMEQSPGFLALKKRMGLQ